MLPLDIVVHIHQIADALHIVGDVGIAVDGVLDGAAGHGKVDHIHGLVVVQHGVDEAAGEGITAAHAVEDIKGVLPIFKNDLSEIIGQDAVIYIDESDPQTINFEYPHIFTTESILQSIRLEIGALAAWTPAKEKSVTPYAAECYPKAFGQATSTILTAAAERTFWEKVTILHHEANRPENLAMPKRYSRHYYDLYCIAHSENKTAAFEDLELLKKVVTFKMKFYPRKWAKYEEAIPGTIKLVPPAFRFDSLRTDYEDMAEMMFGQYFQPKEIELPDYGTVAADVAFKLWDEHHGQFDIPYVPAVAPGWDSTPRYIAPANRPAKADRSQWPGCTIFKNENPASFKAFVQSSFVYLNKHPEVPRILTIACFNEWSEGHYLLPDNRFGYGMLDALGEALGKEGNHEKHGK